MGRFWLLLYNFCFVPLLFCVFQVTAIFNKKIARGISGRRNEFARLKSQLDKLPQQGYRVWFHISSLGEFEQARPVIQLLKQQVNNAAIIVTFFSPSGFDNVKPMPEIDLITYLPFDSYGQARTFIRSIRPHLALVIRHDIWPNHVWRCAREKIPLLLLDAAISEKSYRVYKMVKSFTRHLLAPFHQLFAISKTDAERLRSLAPAAKIQVYGDTRYDQVYNRARETGKIDWLCTSRYFDSKRVLVAGSIWPSDETHIVPAIIKIFNQYDDFILIAVPHEPTPAHVQNLETIFQNHDLTTKRMSQLGQTGWNFKILIVDSIGLLANLYMLGQVAYVGGSFGPGVHSVLEPAAHGCPVLFGPRHLNSFEAQLLLARGGAFAITDATDCYEILLKLFGNIENARNAGKLALDLVLENVGASQKTVTAITTFLPG